MPKEKDLPTVVQRLIDQLKKDEAMGPLISSFKVKQNLGLDYMDKKNKKNAYPMIVIYPAEGQEKVQKLLGKLQVLFKDTKGLGITPRFNLLADKNGLIYYAQGDADFKENNKKYFDESENRALYKKDFTGEVRDYHLKVQK